MNMHSVFFDDKIIYFFTSDFYCKGNGFKREARRRGHESRQARDREQEVKQPGGVRAARARRTAARERHTERYHR